jgi:adenylate cyclase, class 2
MAQEIEIKLRLDDIGRFRTALRRMGARFVQGRTGRIHEWNTVFDTARHDLQKREQLLRIRIETPDGPGLRSSKNTRTGLLTYKQPSGTGKSTRSGRQTHKIREELELPIGNPGALALIFEGLGFRASVHYEKYRTTYQLPPAKRWAAGLLIELDETPIGTFVELEGPPKAIDRAASELGFSKKDYILKNYLRLYVEDCERRGIKPSDMVFPKRSKGK